MRDTIEEIIGDLAVLEFHNKQVELKYQAEIEELTDKMHEYIGVISKQREEIRRLKLRLHNNG